MIILANLQMPLKWENAEQHFYQTDEIVKQDDSKEEVLVYMHLSDKLMLKQNVILQTNLSNVFSWMEMIIFW